MAVSANATASNVSSVPIPLFANRFQPLEGLQSDEEAIRLHVRFQAEGVYKPPHMRTPSEPVASTAGSDPMVGGTAVVRPTHGTSFDREGRGTSRPHTPHTGLAPEPVAFGFDEMKKMIQEEIMNVRKAEEKMEMIVKELLKEEAHIEQYTQVLRSAGFTDEERRTIVNGNHPGFMPGQPTAQSPNPKVGICYMRLCGEKAYRWFDRALRRSHNALTSAPSGKSDDSRGACRKGSKRSWLTEPLFPEVRYTPQQATREARIRPESTGILVLPRL